MKVNFYATLRQITGQKTVEFELPDGSTVRELVNIIIDSYPTMGRELLNEDDELWPHVHVFVNGRDARYLPSGSQAVLRPGDKVSIFPPVGGG
jgi:molybdopterin synthase sulfur carrier subunit